MGWVVIKTGALFNKANTQWTKGMWSKNFFSQISMLIDPLIHSYINTIFLTYRHIQKDIENVLLKLKFEARTLVYCQI